MNWRTDKTKQAVKRVLEGERAYAVAREMGISPSGLYVALARERKKATQVRCECCGSWVDPSQIKPIAKD